MSNNNTYFNNLHPEYPGNSVSDFSIKVSLYMGGIDRPIMRKTRGTERYIGYIASSSL